MTNLDPSKRAQKSLLAETERADRNWMIADYYRAILDKHGIAYDDAENVVLALKKSPLCWMPYDGGDVPVPPDTYVDMSFGPDDVDTDVKAGTDWRHLFKPSIGRGRLTHWRLSRPIYTGANT